MGVLGRRHSFSSQLPPTIEHAFRSVSARRVIAGLVVLALVVRLFVTTFSSTSKDLLFLQEQEATGTRNPLRPIHALPQQPILAKLYWYNDQHDTEQQEASIDYSDVVQRNTRKHFEYDLQHGYESYLLSDALVDGSWNKPAFMLAVLTQELLKPEAQRLRWLCWVDHDIVITNPTIPLDLFLPPPSSSNTSSNLLITADLNGLTSPIFLLRITTWSHDLLTAVLGMRVITPDDHVAPPKHAQEALSILVNEVEDFSTNVTYLPQRWINSYTKGLLDPIDGQIHGFTSQQLQESAWQPGDLHLRLPGDGMKQMGEVLDLAEKKMPGWGVSANASGLVGRVERFWSEEARKVEEAREARKREEEERERRLVVEMREKAEKEEERLRKHQELMAQRNAEGIAGAKQRAMARAKAEAAARMRQRPKVG